MQQNLEFNLLLNILRAPNIKHPINSAIDWQLFYKLTIRHRVWHKVYAYLKHTSLPITTLLEKYCQQDLAKILMTAQETIRVTSQFEKQKIHYFVVKGVLLNMHIYKGINTRSCRDIDIFVQESDFDKAVAELLMLGYQQEYPTYDLTGYKKTWYMRHRHDISFYHPQYQILVELHFTTSDVGVSFFPCEQVPRQAINVMNKFVYAPEDDYHLLYLSIHGAVHSWIRLRWLHDIAIFIQSGKCDLMRIYDLSEQLQCQYIVESTLILVQKYFAIDNEDLRKILQAPSRRALQLSCMAEEFIEADYEMEDGVKNLKMFFKCRLYRAKLVLPKHRVKAILFDLFKIGELFPYVTFPRYLTFMYYVVYPAWVVKFLFK